MSDESERPVTNPLPKEKRAEGFGNRTRRISGVSPLHPLVL
jgi:hypothetical protein